MYSFPQRHSRIGATLIELMIASTLLLLVMSSVSMLISASSRHYMVMDASLDLQKESVLAANWVTREMAESNENSVTYFAPGTGREGVTFGSPRTHLGGMQYTNGGALVWQKRVCFYIDIIGGKSALQRTEWPLEIRTTYPPRVYNIGQFPGPAHTPAYFLGVEAPRRLVAKNVDRLVVDTSVAPIAVTLELSSIRHGKPFSATIQSKVHFRN